jgi:hypothetical protein
MHAATVDERKRIRLPSAKPGQVFAIESSSDGKVIRLTQVEPVQSGPARVRFAKKDGFTVLVSDRPIDEAALKAALEEFP